jgi:hypothetical protein
MPKAMLISTQNVDRVSEIAQWNLEHDTSLDGYWYVEDVQFLHGYVEAAIITPQTFDATFKIPDSRAVDPEMELISVDYK